MIELVTATFLIGFFGSLHCVGMCGGLVTALSLTRPRLWWPGLLGYQAGRVLIYGAFGVLAGLLGGAFHSASWFQNAQQALALFAAALMIIFALYLGGWLPDPFARLTQLIARTTGLSRWTQRAATGASPAPWLVVGMLNGLLPCGLVYAGLAVAMTTAAPLPGGIAMIAFGLGTVPAMTAVPAVLRTLTPTARGRFLKVAALLLIALALLTVARGSLHGAHQHTAATPPANSGPAAEADHAHSMHQHQH